MLSTGFVKMKLSMSVLCNDEQANGKKLLNLNQGDTAAMMMIAEQGVLVLMTLHRHRKRIINEKTQHFKLPGFRLFPYQR